MAKRCDCHGIVEALERDPRLRALPLAPRMLWFALIRAMQSLSGSVLRFGSQSLTPIEIAMLVGISESELEANLPPLLTRGLLEQEADGALSSPLLRGLGVRSEINRANGLKGGAARRAQAEARRAQTSLALPIAGGAVAATSCPESEAKPSSLSNSVPDAPKLKLSTDLEDSLKPKLAISNHEFHRIGRAAFEAAGFDPARSPVNYGIVRQWLSDGASETLILETIRSTMARGSQPTHMGYFTKAIQAAVRRGTDGGGCEPTARSMAYDYAFQQWVVDNKRGRMPMLRDFAVDGTRIAAA